MGRGLNAQLAVDEYKILEAQHGYTAGTAWRGIATLLLTCEIQKHGSWQATGLKNCVIYMDADRFEPGAGGVEGATIAKGQSLAAYLAAELGVPLDEVCSKIGTYWQTPAIREQQYNNLMGHAFRSLCVNILETYGDKGVTYTEEQSPYVEFPGFDFRGASKRARIDIIARRGPKTVAIISTKWRYRHDRMEFLDEGLRYVTAARRHNENCELYAIVGEFNAARLDKLLHSAPPISPRGPLSAAVHFAPQLIWNGTKDNGRTVHLKSLEWLAAESFNWH